MKYHAVIAIIIMIFTFHQSASAYSAIWTIDGWDTARLKEAGITVTTWKHDQIGEMPPLNWVEITYDSSKLAEAPEILMTLHVIAPDNQTVSTQRVERKKGESGMMKMLFAVPKENIENSYVQIMAPKLISDGTEREIGDPGFGGYSLRLSRIMQLAAEADTNKPKSESKPAEPAGAAQPAPRPESKSEGGDQPQPESESPSR